MTLRLLLVHAHPDDETINHGATVAAALAGGHSVDLVTCTRGEEGEVIGAEHAHRVSARQDTLGDERERELAAALVALAGGADAPQVRHHWLDTLAPGEGVARRSSPRYRDSGMVVLPGGRAAVPPDVREDCFAVADLDEAASRLAGLLRRRRPHVLLTYGPHGGYGHPDHVMAHRVAMRALQLADPDWTVPWVFGAAGDADELRRWLRAHGHVGGWDPDGPLPQMFVPPDDIDATVDAQAWLPAKATAMRALPTQVTVLSDVPGAAAFALSNEVPQPLSGVEHHQLLRPVGAGAAGVRVEGPLAALLRSAGCEPAVTRRDGRSGSAAPPG